MPTGSRPYLVLLRILHLRIHRTDHGAEHPLAQHRLHAIPLVQQLADPRDVEPFGIIRGVLLHSVAQRRAPEEAWCGREPGQRIIIWTGMPREGGTARDVLEGGAEGGLAGIPLLLGSLPKAGQKSLNPLGIEAPKQNFGCQP